MFIKILLENSLIERSNLYCVAGDPYVAILQGNLQANGK